MKRKIYIILLCIITSLLFLETAYAKTDEVLTCEYETSDKTSSAKLTIDAWSNSTTVYVNSKGESCDPNQPNLFDVCVQDVQTSTQAELKAYVKTLNYSNFAPCKNCKNGSKTLQEWNDWHSITALGSVGNFDSTYDSYGNYNHNETGICPEYLIIVARFSSKKYKNVINLFPVVSNKVELKSVTDAIIETSAYYNYIAIPLKKVINTKTGEDITNDTSAQEALANDIPKTSSTNATQYGYEEATKVTSLEDYLTKENNSYEQTSYSDCEELLGDSMIDLLNQVFKIIRILAPIIFVIFTAWDYFKAAISQDKDEIKKTSIKMLKRLIIIALIFLLPIILKAVLAIAGIDGDCGIV